MIPPVAKPTKNRLVADILRFTFTPDTQDMKFSGVQSGESMKYKLMASDNYREKQERLFKRLNAALTLSS